MHNGSSSLGGDGCRRGSSLAGQPINPAASKATHITLVQLNLGISVNLI
jgi:hypothetical protein